MAISKINETKCSGCGLCAVICPADVFRLDKEIKKAQITYPEECVLCCWCAAECPENAIF